METCLHTVNVALEGFVVMLHGDASHDNVSAYLLTEDIIAKL